jgi:hypothetical protein
MPGNAVRLYDEDFVRWTEEQGAALRQAARSGTNLPLDWENLAEEVESLGRSERRELRNRIAVILEHLLELQCSRAQDPRSGWMDTIERERSNIGRLLEDSPSLRNELADLIAQEITRARRLAARSLERHGEADAARAAGLGDARYAPEQVIGDWFPDET